MILVLHKMSGFLIPFSDDIHPTELTYTSGHSSGALHRVGVHLQIDHPYSSALSHRSGARKNSGILGTIPGEPML